MPHKHVLVLPPLHTHTRACAHTHTRAHTHTHNTTQELTSTVYCATVHPHSHTYYFCCLSIPTATPTPLQDYIQCYEYPEHFDKACTTRACF